MKKLIWKLRLLQEIALQTKIYNNLAKFGTYLIGKVFILSLPSWKSEIFKNTKDQYNLEKLCLSDIKRILTEMKEFRQKNMYETLREEYKNSCFRIRESSDIHSLLLLLICPNTDRVKEDFRIITAEELELDVPSEPERIAPPSSQLLIPPPTDTSTSSKQQIPLTNQQPRLHIVRTRSN